MNETYVVVVGAVALLFMGAGAIGFLTGYTRGYRRGSDMTMALWRAELTLPLARPKDTSLRGAIQRGEVQATITLHEPTA